MKYFLSETKGHLFATPFNKDASLDFPPLYYTMLNLWSRVFGVSEFSLRFPSLIFSMLTIIFVYKFSSMLFNKKIGIISAFLLSIFPYSINYAQEAKPYSMLWFFGLLSFLSFYKFTLTNNIRTLIAYVVSATIALYTVYLGIFFIIIQNILFFCCFFKPYQLKKWLISQALIVIFYIPWIGVFLQSVFHKSGIYWIPKIDNHLGLINSVFMLVTGLEIGRYLWIEKYVYLLLLASAILCLKNRKDRKSVFDINRTDVLVFSWIVIPFILLFFIDAVAFPVFIIRYVGFIHIPLAIVFAKGISKYSIKISLAILVFLSSVIFTNHLFPYNSRNLKINGEEWKSLFHRLNEEVREDDLVMISVSRREMKYLKEGIGYYYEGPDIKLFDENEIGSGRSPREYDSIFVIYRGHRPEIKKLKQYHLVEYCDIKNDTYKEDKNIKSIGFLRFAPSVEKG